MLLPHHILVPSIYMSYSVQSLAATKMETDWRKYRSQLKLAVLTDRQVIVIL